MRFVIIVFAYSRTKLDAEFKDADRATLANEISSYFDEKVETLKGKYDVDASFLVHGDGNINHLLMASKLSLFRPMIYKRDRSYLEAQIFEDWIAEGSSNDGSEAQLHVIARLGKETESDLLGEIVADRAACAGDITITLFEEDGSFTLSAYNYGDQRFSGHILGNKTYSLLRSSVPADFVEFVEKLLGDFLSKDSLLYLWFDDGATGDVVEKKNTVATQLELDQAIDMVFGRYIEVLKKTWDSDAAIEEADRSLNQFFVDSGYDVHQGWFDSVPEKTQQKVVSGLLVRLKEVKGDSELSDEIYFRPLARWLESVSGTGGLVEGLRSSEKPPSKVSGFMGNVINDLGKIFSVGDKSANLRGNQVAVNALGNGEFGSAVDLFLKHVRKRIDSDVAIQSANDVIVSRLEEKHRGDWGMWFMDLPEEDFQSLVVSLLSRYKEIVDSDQAADDYLAPFHTWISDLAYDRAKQDGTEESGFMEYVNSGFRGHEGMEQVLDEVPQVDQKEQLPYAIKALSPYVNHWLEIEGFRLLKNELSRQSDVEDYDHSADAAKKVIPALNIPDEILGQLLEIAEGHGVDAIKEAISDFLPLYINIDHPNSHAVSRWLGYLFETFFEERI